ncbi:MAG: Sir2-like protein [Herbinix sp.]|nr:Sir2-like protein [Anaerocolumna sp.]MDF2844696.1 Sir2-like protein [Herbinix sp.]
MSSIIGIWPSNLVEELAYRRGILFLGSGVSATAKKADGTSPDTWRQFLNHIRTIARAASPDDNAYIDDRLACKDYLLALQAIYDKCDLGEYGKYLQDTYLRSDFQASNVHKAIKRIDSKIVITTNFDKIYDNLCNEQGYIITNYEKTKAIVQNIKSPNNLIIKAHGTIEDVENIIFTASQYYNKQEKYPEFYELLYALFLTHTVVFLGYSLNDPDINLILQFLHNSANVNSPHYLVKEKGTPEQLKKHWKATYNVQIIEYGNSFIDFEPAIEELCELVEALRSDRMIP